MGHVFPSRFARVVSLQSSLPTIEACTAETNLRFACGVVSFPLLRPHSRNLDLARLNGLQRAFQRPSKGLRPPTGFLRRLSEAFQRRSKGFSKELFQRPFRSLSDSSQRFIEGLLSFSPSLCLFLSWWILHVSICFDILGASLPAASLSHTFLPSLI